MTYLLDTNAVSDLMRAAPGIESWMAGLDSGDRLVTCTIVRGEILYGINKLPESKRRAELEQTGHRFLAFLGCEPVPERAATSTLPSSVLGNNKVSRWMKMISG